jgi:hypothetical protein
MAAGTHRIQFVSTVVKPGNPVVLSAKDNMGLVVSNACIPDPNPSAAAQPCRLFGTLSSRAGEKSLLCTLVPMRSENEQPAFKVGPGRSVKLEAGGPHNIHVAGYLQEPGPDDEFESDRDDSDSD